MEPRPAVALLMLLGLGVLGCGRDPKPEYRVRTMDELSLDEPARHQALARGDLHEYPFRLAAGASLHVVVEQEGVDILAEVTGPSERPILTVDSPIEDHGFEHVCFAAESPGLYKLRIRSWIPDAAGQYSIRRRPSRPPADRRCERAARAFAEAEHLRQQGGKLSAELLVRYEEAVALWRQADEPYPLAIALKQLGTLASSSGDVRAAVRSYEEALALLRQSGDGRQEASVRNRLGLAYQLLGEPDRARSLFEEALEISRRLQDSRFEASALNNLALWAKSTGEVHRAIELFREVLDVLERLGNPNTEASTLLNLGFSYMTLGRLPEARDVLQDALKIREEIGRAPQLANVLAALGRLDHLSDDAVSAVGHLQRAIGLYREAGDRLGEAGALDRLGTAYRASGRLAEALEAYQESLAIFEVSGNRLHTAHTTSNLGCLLGDLERWEEALGKLVQAHEELETLGDRGGLAHVKFCRAQVERGRGRLKAARHWIEGALEVVDDLRSLALRQGHRYPSLSFWQDYSELYVDVLMELHEQEPEAGHDIVAFEASDLARARRLAEMLQESRIDVRSGVDARLLERERSVQRQLNAAEMRRQGLLAAGEASGEVVELERSLRRLLLEWEEMQAEFKAASPRFAELRQPSPVRLDEVQQLLEPDTLLLSYVLAEERSFLFLVSRERLTSYVLPGRGRLDELARVVYNGLKESYQRRTQVQRQAVTRTLSQVLVGPILEELGGHRLLVVGDGMLHYIPFAALPWPADSGAEEEELLIDRYEVVHLPSAAVIRSLRQRAGQRTKPSRTVAVLADPVFSPRDERFPEAEVRGAASSGLPLRRLPHTREEAEAILEGVVPEQRLVALGFEASAELVRSGRIQEYGVLHFATHGVLDEVRPELSGVVLSMFDEEGRPRDGHLRLHEIYSLQLPADLVVLSACRTALGRRVRGEGLVGLTHGFFYAGASRLLVSLWDVHDEATAELMTAFYRGLLEEGLSPTTALRAAQRRIRREERWRAAYFWAGFVLEGDWK